MRDHRAFPVHLGTFLAGGAVLLGIGCTQDVTPVGDGTGGEASSSTAQGGNGGAGTSSTGPDMVSSVSSGGAGSYTAIAMLESEVPEPGSGGGDTGSSSSGGPGRDPNALRVFVSDVPIACAAPYDGPPCGHHWQVSFSLPPEMQQPGTYSMEAIGGYYFLTLDGNRECAAGGGSFWDGQVEITSIDATGVSGAFLGTSTLDFDANGSFTAPRCFQ